MHASSAWPSTHPLRSSTSDAYCPAGVRGFTRIPPAWPGPFAREPSIALSECGGSTCLRFMRGVKPLWAAYERRRECRDKKAGRKPMGTR